jgi:hypothetical protein
MFGDFISNSMLTDLENNFLMDISEKTQSGLDLSRFGLVRRVIGPLCPGAREKEHSNRLTSGAARSASASGRTGKG